MSVLKNKTLIFLLVLSSFCGYLAWGNNQSSFLIEVEYDVIRKLFVKPKSVLHPLILLPLIGQAILIISLFQKGNERKLMFTGIVCLSILFLFILIVGILSFQIKIIVSVLPFLSLALYSFFRTKVS